METNGDVYEHLPNNNVCPTKNFTIDSVIGDVTSQPGQQDQGMDADFFIYSGILCLIGARYGVLITELERL